VKDRVCGWRLEKGVSKQRRLYRTSVDIVNACARFSPGGIPRLMQESRPLSQAVNIGKNPSGGPDAWQKYEYMMELQLSHHSVAVVRRNRVA